MKRALLITLLVTTVFTTQAQKVWTLDECINYAIEHNLDLQKTQLSRQQAEYQYKASKNAWLPTLSANAGEYLGFGQSPSYTGVYVSDNSSSTSFGASLSLPLFQGLNFYNTAKADALNLQATEMDQKATQLNLKLNHKLKLKFNSTKRLEIIFYTLFFILYFYLTYSKVIL